MIAPSKAWRLGARLYGAAAMLFGVIGLTWGAFSAIYQPVPGALAERAAVPYLVFAGLFVGGAATQVRRAARPGLCVVIAVYLVFALGWARRVVAYPHLYSVWNGCAQQLALAAAGSVAYAAATSGASMRAIRAGVLARILFGICVLSFGVQHFYELDQTAQLVPPWLPPGQRFWAVVTGVADLLAGVAIVSGILGLLAARLLTLKFGLYVALIWTPALLRAPDQHFVWVASAVTLAAAASAWVVADWLASRGRAQAAAHLAANERGPR